MATVTLPHRPQGSSPRQIAQILANFDAILAEFNGGTDADNLENGAVTEAKLAAAVIAKLVPTGSIFAFGDSAAPTGWVLCDGSAISRSTFAALFAVIGTDYGAGDGSTTFNVPNLKGRVPVGRDAGQTEFDTLGETGGAKTHTLSSGEVPDHDHSMQGHTHSGTTGNADNASNTQGGVDVQRTSQFHVHSFTTGGPSVGDTGDAQNFEAAGAHNNLQPYQVVNYIIKT